MSQVINSKLIQLVHGYFNIRVEETSAYKQTMAIISQQLKEVF